MTKQSPKIGNDTLLLGGGGGEATANGRKRVREELSPEGFAIILLPKPGSATRRESAKDSRKSLENQSPGFEIEGGMATLHPEYTKRDGKDFLKKNPKEKNSIAKWRRAAERVLKKTRHHRRSIRPKAKLLNR